MDIKIDEKEYKDLLDILHVADVVMSGHRRAEDKRTERHRALIQKLYGLAKSAGLDQMMSFNEDLKRYAPTHAFEESTLAHVLLDEFGDHLFWDHLINRLSERDAIQLAGGMERLANMSDTDRQNLAGTIRQRYVDEFAVNDITNLRLILPMPAAEGVPVKTSD